MAERITLSRAATLSRALGAACVLAAGVVHLQQYFGVYYRVIPTIGPLFLVDFIASVVACLALLSPLDRIWRPLAPLAALGSIALCAGAIVGLAISESGTLFGFHEHGYRLSVVLALTFEAVAIVLLLGYLGALWRTSGSEASGSSVGPQHRASLSLRH